jgi:hypothetical protein
VNCCTSTLARRFGSVAVAAFAVCSLVAADVPPASEWISEGAANGIAIHSRTRAGSAIKEFRGIGVIDAPPAAVFAVIDDSEAYPSFMPYTAEARVLKRDKNTVINYQRLSLPLVSDRDYTLRSENARWNGPDGPIFRVRWTPANSVGPAPTAGVLRVNVCEGGWLLEPQGSGATRATYTIYTDSGGTLPPMIANSGGKVAIKKVFEAIRRQVKNPKYAEAAAAVSDAPNRSTP